MKRLLLVIAMVLFVATGCSTSVKEEPMESINVYTSRDYEVDRMIFEQFTADTGIAINLVELDNDELVTKVIAEKDNPSSDVVIVNGAQYIYELTEAGVLMPIDESYISSGVDEQFIGDNYVGLTYRARARAYDPNKIDPNEITEYSDLTDPEYEGELLVRSSTNGYNQAWMLNELQNDGYDATLELATGIVNNLAREPKGGDRDQIKAIYAGEGSLAVTNSYYYLQMLNSSDPSEVEAANSVKLLFPTDTHINMTWIGLTSSGSENESVEELVKYLTSPEVQTMYVEENKEFPVNSEADTSSVDAYMNFTTQDVEFATLGLGKEEVYEIFKISGWK